MKTAILLLLTALTLTSSYARDCRDDVSVYFYTINEAREYDDQGVSNGYLKLESGEEILSNDIAVVNEFDHAVLAYEGYSDDNKGFGVEVLFADPESCEILKVIRTY